MKKITYFIMTAIGILSLVFIIYTVITFTPHDYFFIQNPEIEKYVGINVVSPFATFSFFTYHSLIFFSTWLIFFGIGNLLNSNHLVRFLTNSAILSFVCLNYFITCIIYTIFELLAEEITFGLYALTPHGIYNFITNIIVHYLLAFFALGVFLKIKASDLGKDQVHGIKALKLLVFPIVYLTAYYTLVKITGMHCYKIEWYPYPLFDVQSFSALFGLATNNNFVFTSLLLIALFVIAITYCSTLILLINYKRKTASKKN